MNLHLSRLAGIGKFAAPALSQVIRLPGMLSATRGLCAYLNYLLGRGCGAGWDLTPEVQVASSLIFRDDAVVLDVGANIGDWSRLLRGIRPNAFIYQFEPQPACCDAIKALALARTEVIAAAVGETRSTATFYSAQAQDETASLHRRKDTFLAKSTYKEYTVDVIPLDEFARERKIEYIDFLKFDIEGHELYALKGCTQLLAANQIGCIAFEFGSGNINSRTFFRDFWDLFKSHSFELFRILPSGHLLPCLSYYEDEEFFRGVSNYVAISKLARFRPAPAGGGS